jgi:ABC-type transporter Mla maintaining outer membrane lipid asymmetry ATPase subunit MlaF
MLSQFEKTHSIKSSLDFNVVSLSSQLKSNVLSQYSIKNHDMKSRVNIGDFWMLGSNAIYIAGKRVLVTKMPDTSVENFQDT